MEESDFEKKLTKIGLLQAYDYILHMLCKHGLPKNHIYEFAAYHMILFGKKWKTPKQNDQLGAVSLNKKMHNSQSHQNNNKRNIGLHVKTKITPSKFDNEMLKGSDECARAQNLEAIGLHMKIKINPSPLDDSEMLNGSDESGKAQNLAPIGANSNLLVGRVVDNDNVDQ